MEQIDLGKTNGLVKSAPISVKMVGSCGLLEPSGQPAIWRDIGQPFVAFEKRYWMSALNPDRGPRKIDEMSSADCLQVGFSVSDPDMDPYSATTLIRFRI